MYHNIEIFNLDYKMDSQFYFKWKRSYFEWNYIFKKCNSFENIFISLEKGKTKENGVKNTYYGLQEKQGPSRFSRPVAIMGLNGGIKAQCSSQSSYHCFLCYHLCFFHFHWWWNWPTWVLLSKLRVCNIKGLEICPIEKNCGTRFFLVINLNSK